MTSSNVPAFVVKLWKIVNDAGSDDLISWNLEGTKFVVHNYGEFEKKILPYYFKHSNMSSFVRQLNIYGFRKLVDTDSGSLKSALVEKQEFQHPSFLRGQENLLENITRRINNDKKISSQIVPVLAENFSSQRSRNLDSNALLNDILSLKTVHQDMSKNLDDLKLEKEQLWLEVVDLRDKLANQKQLVGKIIRFLGSLMKHPSMQNMKSGIPSPFADLSTSLVPNPQQPLAISMKVSTDNNDVETSGFTNVPENNIVNLKAKSEDHADIPATNASSEAVQILELVYGNDGSLQCLPVTGVSPTELTNHFKLLGTENQVFQLENYSNQSNFVNESSNDSKANQMMPIQYIQPFDNQIRNTGNDSLESTRFGSTKRKRIDATNETTDTTNCIQKHMEQSENPIETSNIDSQNQLDNIFTNLFQHQNDNWEDDSMLCDTLSLQKPNNFKRSPSRKPDSKNEEEINCRVDNGDCLATRSTSLASVNQKGKQPDTDFFSNEYEFLNTPWSVFGNDGLDFQFSNG